MPKGSPKVAGADITPQRPWWVRWSPYLIGVVVFAVLGSGIFANLVSDSGAQDFDIVAYQGQEMLGSQETKLSSLLAAGKPVVLNFWAGSCPPCRAEMPGFQRVATAYAGKVVILGVDLGVFTGLGDHQAAERLLSGLGITYPAAYAVRAAPLRAYNIQGLPATIFITPRGRIVERADQATSERELTAAVERLLLAS